MADNFHIKQEDLENASYRFEEVDTSNIPRNPMGFLWYVSKPYRALAYWAIIVTGIAQILGSLLPYFFKQIVDSTTIAADGGMQNFDDVWFWTIASVILFAVMHAMWRVSGFMGVKWLIAMHATAGYSLFEYLSKHSHGYFSNRFAGALSNKASHATDSGAEVMVLTLWTAFPGALGFLIAFGLVLMTNVWLALLFVVLLIVVIPINWYIVKIRRPRVIAYAEAKTATTGRLVDTITNIFAMQHFARRESELEKYRSYINYRAGKDTKQSMIGEWLVTVNAGIMVVFEAIVIITTIWLWTKGMVTLGDFALILTLLIQIDETVTFIGHTLNRFIRNYAHVQEGLDAILVPHEVEDIPEAGLLKVEHGMIEFKNTTFKYNDEDVSAKVFDNFELCITPHQKVGLVGESGAGKSTLVSLLLRQHDLNNGSIEIDGQNIAKITQESLRENIAVVPQDPMLFHRSIMDNIRYGRMDATDKEVMEAAKMAQAHDFITATPKGYDTLVGERGVKLSGGQRQRIAIARAILKNAPILVLDEATSALDSESEVLIQKALHELMEGKTVIAVAHRLSTLREMDRIIVMEKGKVAQDGSHNELVDQEGIYKRLWSHQAGGFIVE